MNHLLLFGIATVNLALVAYAAATYTASRHGFASNRLMALLTTGVALDLAATILMVSGSSHSFLSSHGVLGYSAFLLMLADCLVLWRLRRTKGANAPLGIGLQRLTRYAFMWWVMAYVAGIAIVALR